MEPARSLILCDTDAVLALARDERLAATLDVLGDRLAVNEPALRGVLEAEERGLTRRFSKDEREALILLCTERRVHDDSYIDKALLQRLLETPNIQKAGQRGIGTARTIAAAAPNHYAPVVGVPILQRTATLVFGVRAVSPREVSTAVARNDYGNLKCPPMHVTSKKTREARRAGLLPSGWDGLGTVIQGR